LWPEESGGRQDCLDGAFGSGGADKSSIEEIQPAVQHVRSISGRIGGEKNQLHLICNPGGELLQCGADIRHVHRTLIRAERVAEEEQGDIALRLAWRNQMAGWTYRPE